MTADIAYVNDDGVTVAQLEAVTQARAERDELARRIAEARAKVEQMPCSPPGNLSCRRCALLKILGGAS